MVEDWGKKHISTSTLGLFVLNVNTRLVRWKTFPSTEHVLLGQPVFTPGGKGMVYVGWDT